MNRNNKKTKSERKTTTIIAEVEFYKERGGELLLRVSLSFLLLFLTLFSSYWNNFFFYIFLFSIHTAIARILFVILFTHFLILRLFLRRSFLSLVL